MRARIELTETVALWLVTVVVVLLNLARLG